MFPSYILFIGYLTSNTNLCGKVYSQQKVPSHRLCHSSRTPTRTNYSSTCWRSGVGQQVACHLLKAERKVNHTPNVHKVKGHAVVTTPYNIAHAFLCDLYEFVNWDH